MSIRRWKRHPLHASLALALATGAAAAQQPTPSLTVHVDQPLHAVSPMLYGLMTEEINYSYDGGLYAEMVRNRTFAGRYHGVPAHWFVSTMGDGIGTMQIDDTTGPSDALPNSLMVDVAKADAKDPVGVSNDGWWGMALKPETTYKGSFYARAESADVGALTLSLTNDNTGTILATATSAPLATEWKQYSFTLKTGAITASVENHLSLTAGHAGKFWINLVSLFPPTYKNRENGNRPDLMEMMAAMHPNFLRLPGGNYLEGDEIADRYDWKNMIGPMVDRPTHPSPWRYQSSDGMGLLEFLEWTEDLNMEPLLAVYAGYSLKGAHINAGPFLQPFVQDALDEIEFVTGDTTTKWGAKRASLGHPKPFPLHYVEIGNEDWFDKSGSYETRFIQFDQAIKAKYPALKTIATTSLKRGKPDVQDDHYYLRAVDSYQHATQYDKTDRNGPKIFIGEWATREGLPTPNFNSALGDAALMTGFERNSDLIIMASYAPLFVNVNPGGMQWESDLIGYDAATSYGSPSYYAQVLFAKYLGDTVPVTEVENAPVRFFYSATVDSKNNLLYLKLVNGSSEAQPVSLKLAGAAKLADGAGLETLSARTPAETNTILDPKRIIPVKSTIRHVKSDFVQTMPPYSIQVLELKLR